MAVYIGLLNLLFLMRFTLAAGIRARGQLYWPTLALLFIFSGYRWEVGCDWSGYLNQFQLAVGLSEQNPLFSGREGLWWWILAQLDLNGFIYPSINVVSSAIFFAGVHVLARRQPDPFSFLILLFPVLIINMPMSGIRQGAAIGVICMAFVAFTDRRPIRFSVLTVLASLLHGSALIFLLLAPLALGRYSRTRLALAALLAVPGLLLLTSGDAAGEAAGRYIGAGVEAFGGALRVSLLVMTAGYFMMFHNRNWRQYSPRDYSLMHLGSLMMLALPALLLVSTIMADRLGYYLIPIQAIILARLPWLPISSNRGLHIVAPYMILIVFFVGWTSMSFLFQLCYLPYSSWIFGVPTPEIIGF